MLSELLTVLVWICLVTQAYHYVGYPALLWLFARLSPTPIHKEDITPRVSLIICCFNEMAVIGQKIENSLALDYPDLEIIINSEGSTDETPHIVSEFSDQGVIAMFAPGRRGKSAAMNDAAQRATGEILVFSDANIFYRKDAIRKLVANFADPTVGMVTGKKEVRPTPHDKENAAAAESFYWRYENTIKELETSIYATVAVHGEMLAIRRRLFEPIPPGTVNDDIHTAMTVLARNMRVVFERDAQGWEAPSKSLEDDAVRRRRISAGRFQLLGKRHLLQKLPTKVLLMFLSHKVLRLILPVIAAVGLVANAFVVFLPNEHTSMWVTLGFQLAVLGLALIGHYGGKIGRSFLPAKISAYIVSGYLAGFLGIVRAFSGGQNVLWEKAGR